MHALQFGDVIGISDVHWAEIFCAEPGQALFSDGNPDFLDAVDVRDLGENLLFVRIECEDRQIFGVEDTENIFTKVQENVIEIAGSMDLVRDALDIFGECHLLLKFLKVLWDGIGLHYNGS